MAELSWAITLSSEAQVTVQVTSSLSIVSGPTAITVHVPINTEILPVPRECRMKIERVAILSEESYRKQLVYVANTKQLIRDTRAIQSGIIVTMEKDLNRLRAQIKQRDSASAAAPENATGWRSQVANITLVDNS